MSVAIVTGATGGLGSAYVDALIKNYPEIDEIWAIARRKERLEKLAEKYQGKHIELISCDLSERESYTMLQELLAEKKPKISFLVCNCGGFVRGDFQEVELERLIKLVDLNVVGTMALTHICLPYMQYGGSIIEVCSSSSFAIEPRIIVYCGTKVFEKFFATGLRFELKYRDGRGINVTAVHPGYMETEMTADQKAASSIPRTNIEQLAIRSLKAAREGHYSYTLGWFPKLIHIGGKLLPSNVAAWIMDRGHELTYKMDDWKNIHKNTAVDPEPNKTY